MLRQKKMKSSKLIALVVALVVIALVIGYLVYTTYIAGPKTYDKTPEAEDEIINTPILNSDFELDFLNKSPYIDLRQFGRLPVTIERTGRNNPFQEIIFFD